MVQRQIQQWALLAAALRGAFKWQHPAGCFGSSQGRSCYIHLQLQRMQLEQQQICLDNRKCAMH
jgi:hypothetical protein